MVIPSTNPPVPGEVGKSTVAASFQVLSCVKVFAGTANLVCAGVYVLVGLVTGTALRFPVLTPGGLNVPSPPGPMLS